MNRNSPIAPDTSATDFTTSDFTAQAAQAEMFHSLHDDLLVLPNAWDAASARVIEDAGARAIATTSAGISWAAGAADGQGLEWPAALQRIREIVAAVTVPVTVDVEGGFAEVEQVVADIISLGVVGINIEDSAGGVLRPSEAMAEDIAVARRTAARSGVPLFINARIDAYLLGAPDPFEDTGRRAMKYLDAGADGIFVPGVVDLSVVSALADRISAPLNVMVGSGAPSTQQLHRSGARRISSGMAIPQAAYAVVRTAAKELLDSGTSSALAEGLEFKYLNTLFG